MGELVVKITDLSGRKKEMKSLAGQLKNRKANLSFSNSSGELVDELNSIAEELNNLGQALGNLCDITSLRIGAASTQFENTDEALAQMMDIKFKI